MKRPSYRASEQTEKTWSRARSQYQQRPLLPALQYLLEKREILSIGTPHGGRHEGRDPGGEPGWRAAIAKGHPRAVISHRLPRVRGLHREGTVGRPHDQTRARIQLGNLVRVRHSPPQEMGDEGDPGTDRNRGGRLPL